MNLFSERLKKLRKESKETQIEIGDLLSVSGQSYGAYEAGREPDFEKLVKLAEHFNVSVDYLLGRSDSRNPENDALAEETGLSGKAIETIKKYYQYSKDIGESESENDFPTESIERYSKIIGDIDLSDDKREFIDVLNSILECDSGNLRDLLWLVKLYSNKDFENFVDKPINEQKMTVGTVAGWILEQDFLAIGEQIRDLQKLKE